MKSSQTNTFTGGMQKDLHPLTTPNTVLTDALNATITTMNGNESVLQNDMGNARVESAYLPEGYIPIGMKEYGGIIYIASYNPITKKGQVGSFPSPERNIESIEGKECLLNLNSLLLSKIWDDTNNYSEIVNYSIKYEIEDGRIFHPGDMFSLIADINSLNNNITFSKQLGNKVNGDITLGLYVMDSSNNLINITDSLNFYYPEDIIDKNNIIIHHKGDIITDIEDRYLGTFIKPSISNQESQVDGERSYTDYNTFNSKIAGKTYLIATLNSINSLDVDLSGETKINSDNTAVAYLNLDLQYKFNCTESNIIEPIINLYKINNLGEKEKIQFNSSFDTNISPYNQSAELGSTIKNVKHKIQLPFNVNEDNQIYVEVIPRMRLFNGNINSMQSLKSTLEIDLNKLNSGEFKIISWRYYNNIVNGDSRTNLVWGLEAYPKKSQKVKQIRFKFKDLLSGNESILDISGKKNYFGTFNESLDLINKTLYLVQLFKVIEDEQEEREEFIGERFILTTQLLNNCFFAESQTYLQDYGNIKIDGSLKGKEVFNSLHTVEMDGESSNALLLQLLPNTVESEHLEIIKSSETPSINNYKYTEQESSYLINYIPKVKNSKNYPFILDKSKFGIDLNINNIQASSQNNSINYEVYNTGTSNTSNYIKYDVLDVQGNRLSKKVNFTNHLISKFSGNYIKTPNMQIKTLFKSLSLEDLFGFGYKEDPWWLANRIHVVNLSGRPEQAIGEVLTWNKNTGSVIYRFYDRVDRGTNHWRVSMDEDSGGMVYNKIVNYLTKSKNKPTVAMWSSFGKAEVKEIPPYYTGISKTDTSNRNYQFEYAWWLGTDGNYYLLRNSIIPNIVGENNPTLFKESFTLPNKIVNSLSNLYIGNKADGLTKTLYVLNPGQYKDTSYTVDTNININILPIFDNVDNTQYFIYNNSNYWNTITNNYNSELLKNNKLSSIINNTQLQFFNFTLNTQSQREAHVETIDLSLESKGYEDELNLIKKTNLNSEVSVLLDTGTEVYLSDYNHKEFDINKAYALDPSDQKLKSIDNIQELKGLYSIFTLGTDGYGNKTLLVRPQRTSKADHTWYQWDEANEDTWFYFYFSDMNSFAIPTKYLNNTVSINAGKLD